MTGSGDGELRGTNACCNWLRSEAEVSIEEEEEEEEKEEDGVKAATKGEGASTVKKSLDETSPRARVPNININRLIIVIN